MSDRTDPHALQAGHAEPPRVVLSRIRVDKAYQVRSKLDAANRASLKRKYEAGVAVTPITVAEIEGQANPVLIDGFHRHAAMLALGFVDAPAFIIKATEQEARWLAASANLGHGLPLKTSELRGVFKAFIGARKHIDRKRRGSSMLSYRDISQQIGVPHTPIRRWMMADYPKIANKMADDEGRWKGEGGLRERSHGELSRTDAKVAEALETVREAFKATNDPERRGRLIETAEETLREMKEMGDWTASDF